MANEIFISLTGYVKNGNLRTPFMELPAQHFDQMNAGAFFGTQEIGDTETQIRFSSDVNTEGLLLIVNLSNSESIDWGPQVDTGNAEFVSRLGPKQFAILPLKPGVSLRAKTTGMNPAKLAHQLFEA